MITGGKFIGKSGHTMQGTFTLTQTDKGMQMVLSEDFFFDAAAPAPVWALGAPNTTPFPALIEGSIWQKLEPFTPISGKKKYLFPNTSMPFITRPLLHGARSSTSPWVKVASPKDKRLMPQFWN